jgi:hypothetical protein
MGVKLGLTWVKGMGLGRLRVGSAEEDIWVWKGGNGGRMENITLFGTSWFVVFRKYCSDDIVKEYEMEGALVRRVETELW